MNTMSKLIGYRTLTIYSESSICILERAVNKYLKDGWVLHGTTANLILNGENTFTQIMVKYSDSTEPKITKFRLIAAHNCSPDFEDRLIKLINNTWTLFGYTWHTIDSKGISYYSQAIVQYESLNAFF